MDEKVLLSLVSVVVGWLLAQGTAFAKDYWSARKIKRGLVQELLDLQLQMQPVVMLYTRHLQIYALGGVDPNGHLPISNAFFKQYYKDVMLYLNSAERRSFQLIHAGIDTLNREGDDFIRFTKELYMDLKEASGPEAVHRSLEMWGGRSAALYKNAKDVLWYIEYHLRNPSNPGLEPGSPGHESYLKFLDEVNAESNRIIHESRGLKREDFSKNFHASFFLAQ